MSRLARLVRVIPKETLRLSPDQVLVSSLDHLDLDKDDVIADYYSFSFYDDWLAGRARVINLTLPLERTRAPGSFARFKDVIEAVDAVYVHLLVSSPDAALLAPHIRPQPDWYKYTFQFVRGVLQRCATIYFSEHLNNSYSFLVDDEYGQKVVDFGFKRRCSGFRHLIVLFPDRLYIGKAPISFTAFLYAQMGYCMADIVRLATVKSQNSVYYRGQHFRADQKTHVWELSLETEDSIVLQNRIAQFAGDEVIVWPVTRDRGVSVVQRGVFLRLADYDDPFRAYLWSYAHKDILDITLSLLPLDLPPYVVLEIVDWLPGIHRHTHVDKIALIVAVRESARRVRTARALESTNVASRTRRARLQAAK